MCARSADTSAAPVASAWAAIAASKSSIEPIILRLGDQPHRVVRLIDDSSDEMEMDVTGDAALIESNRQRGITYPFKVARYRTQKYLTTTGPAAQDGSFSIERVLEDVASFTEDAKGRRIAVPDTMKDMVGAVMKGIIDAGGRMRIESIEGGNLDAAKQKVIKSLVNTDFPVEKAPKAPLRIGESFVTEAPMAIPIPGHGTIALNARTRYALENIDGDRAVFAMTTSFDLASAPQGARTSVEGTGTGTMTYNTRTRLQEASNMHMQATTRFESGELRITSKLRSTSSQHQSLVGSPGMRAKRNP
jgi:hypothetical protein